MQTLPESLHLAVVVPVYNEALNVKELALEILTALKNRVASFEVIFVDDGSSDTTLAELKSLAAAHPELRYLVHNKNYGQSASVVTGVRHAHANWIATLDGDGQNNPIDILKMLKIVEEQQFKTNILLAGNRQKRQDNRLKLISTKIANKVRKTLLRDDCPDTGCGLKLFNREFFLKLPHFNHVHRFLPALTRRAGGTVINVPVSHRPRVRGASKYGVWNRLWVGIVDLGGVMWLIRRNCNPEIIPETTE